MRNAAAVVAEMTVLLLTLVRGMGPRPDLIGAPETLLENPEPLLESPCGSNDVGAETHDRGVAADAGSPLLPLVRTRRGRTGAEEENEEIAGTKDDRAGISRGGKKKRAGVTVDVANPHQWRDGAAVLLGLDPGRFRRRCGGGPAPVLRRLTHVPATVIGGRDLRPLGGVTAETGREETGLETTAETANSEKAKFEMAAAVVVVMTEEGGWTVTAASTEERVAIDEAGIGPGPARVGALLTWWNHRWRAAAAARGRKVGAANTNRPPTKGVAVVVSGSTARVSTRTTTTAAAQAGAERSTARTGTAATAMEVVAHPLDETRRVKQGGCQKFSPPRRRQRHRWQRC